MNTEKSKKVFRQFLLRLIIILLIFPSISNCRVSNTSSDETAGGSMDMVSPPPDYSLEPVLEIVDSGCGDARSAANLRLSDGQLVYGATGSSRAVFLGGSGSYELVSDPSVLEGIARKDGDSFNVFTFLLNSEPEEGARGINFFRVWLPGLSTGSAEWGAVSLSEREELPYYREQNGLWDLTRYEVNGNPATASGRYFARLHKVLKDSLAKGVILQLTIFDHTMMKWLDAYDPETETYRAYRYWHHNPWNPKNNVNDLWHELPTDYPPFPEFYQIGMSDADSPRPKLRALQKKYVQTLVAQTKDYPNVFYEVMNQAMGAQFYELALWHLQVIQWIREIAPEKLISISSFPLISYLDICVSAGSNDPLCSRLLDEVDIMCYHYANESWAEDYFSCTDDIPSLMEHFHQVFPEKLAIIDTDGAGGRYGSCRENNDNVYLWATRSFANGAGFNHKDYINSDPDTASASCASNPERPCGFMYDCVPCGIESVDREAIDKIAQAYEEQPPSQRSYYDVEISALRWIENAVVVTARNIGTKVLPTQMTLWDNCASSAVSWQPAQAVLPGEEFRIVISDVSPGLHTLRFIMVSGSKNKPIGRSISFELHERSSASGTKY